MKFFTFVLMFIFIAGCEKAGEETANGSGNFEVPDQVLQGTINGVSYTFVEGAYEEDPFDPTKITISLYGNDIADVCNPGFGEDRPVKVFFSIVDSVQETSLSIGSNSQTVTMYDYDNGGNSNIFATSGLISITSTDGSTIQGGLAMDATSGSRVQGTFTATNCD